MPMGIINDDEFTKELEKLNSHSTKQEIKYAEIKERNNGGRNKGDVETPESLRKIIGETSVIEGRSSAIELAKKFGISHDSVSAYKNGATSCATYNKPNKDILDHINKSKERISKRARHTLNRALTHITEDKLIDAKPEVLSNVARNMAGIVREMEPQQTQSSNENNGVQFIFYSPKIRNESDFDVIDLTSE